MTGPRHKMRNLELEYCWLEGAEAVAGRSGFAEHARNRLAAGELAYGNRWAELELADLLVELCEEAADLGAWGVLALQALDLDRTLSELGRPTIAARLHGAILTGARAHHELERARTELHRALQAPTRRRFTPDVDGGCLNCGRTYSAHANSRCRPGVDQLLAGGDAE